MLMNVISQMFVKITEHVKIQLVLINVIVAKAGKENTVEKVT